MQRLFMDPYQKRLTDPQQYRAPIDRKQIMAEVEAGATGINCHETFSFMKRAVNEVNPKGALTIEAVADSYESMRRSAKSAPDRSLLEFANLSSCGDHALVNYLIRRANDLSEGIQPGAKQTMGDAFGR